MYDISQRNAVRVALRTAVNGGFFFKAISKSAQACCWKICLDYSLNSKADCWASGTLLLVLVRVSPTVRDHATQPATVVMTTTVVSPPKLLLL